MRAIVAAGILVALSPAAHAGRLIVEGALCDGVDVQAEIDKALDFAITGSQLADCLHEPALKKLAERIRSNALPHDIHVRCGVESSWPHTGCLHGKNCGSVPNTPDDAVVILRFDSDRLAVASYTCPLIPSPVDFGAMIHHELKHAEDIVDGTLDLRTDLGTKSYVAQLRAIDHENIYRRARGTCQRRQDGGALDFEEKKVDELHDLTAITSKKKCACDPQNVDLFGARTCSGGAACCNGSCLPTCGPPSSIGPACNYIDSDLAESLMGKTVEKTDTMQGSFSCNFYGDLDPRFKPPQLPVHRRIATLLLTPHGGVGAKQWAKGELQQGVDLKTTPRKLETPLGLIAFAWLEGDRYARQLHVLLPRATINLSVWGKEGVPTDLDAMIAAAQQIIHRIDPTFVSQPPPDVSDLATAAAGSGATAGSGSADGGPTSSDMFVAKDDKATTSKGVTAIVNVLANDTPVDRSVVTVTVGVVPHGVVKVRTGNNLDYTPAAGFVGTDTFQYSVTAASGVLGTATVTMTVTP